MEKNFTETDVTKQANKYLDRFNGGNFQHIKDEIWSDYNNVPSSYKRPMFADRIIRTVESHIVSNNVVNNILS